VKVNIHEAKTNLSRLIERAQMGEDVIIAKAGKPVAKLLPIREAWKRVLGSAAGKIVFRKGWDCPLTDRELTELLGS